MFIYSFFFFDIPLLHYYISLNLSITYCLSSGYVYIYIYIYIYIGILLLTLSKLFCEHFFKGLVILFAISLPVKSPVVSSAF